MNSFKMAGPADALFRTLSPEEKKVDDVMAKISIEIIKARKAFGMTQKEFAEYMGVRQSLVSKWESAMHNFTVKSVVEIFERLDSAEKLFERLSLPDKRTASVDTSFKTFGKISTGWEGAITSPPSWDSEAPKEEVA